MCKLKTFGFVLAVVMGTGLTAQAQITTEDFKHSVWNTNYVAINGQSVDATVVLDGQTGYYDVAGGRGELLNITYRFDEVQGKFKATVRGRWSMGGYEGSFQFVSSNYLNPPEWNGSYEYLGQQNYRWTGRLSHTHGGTQPQAQRGGTYGPWQDHPTKDYCYRICSLPAGGKQYLICYDNNPNWIYWFNPTNKVFWCACPTINHPTYGCKIRSGQDLFLMASNKASTIDDTVFPDPGANGANFKSKASVKDADGSTIDVNPPPTDLPD